MSTLRIDPTPAWAEALFDRAAEEQTARNLIGQLVACEVAALAFCRLLERWARGEASPPTAGQRQAALRRAADRAETALAGLERPLGRYLLELEPDQAEGRSWYGQPGPAELMDWGPVLAVLVRALEGLTTAVRMDAPPDRSSLWAGLFDLRENLLGGTLEDLRALAA